MHPSLKRLAARLTGESPPSQRTRRSVLPPSLLPKPLLPLNYHPRILRQPPRREYNTVQPSFILEELEEIRNNPEAAVEAEEPLTIISLYKMVAIRGRSQERGGTVRDIITVTLCCPHGNPRIPLRWSSVTCRGHMPLVYSLLDPRGLTSLRIRLLYNLSYSYNPAL